MIKTGTYTKRLRKTNKQLEPHFFEPSVLDRYRNDPDYALRETGLGTTEGSDAKPSSLQQYVWGHKANGSPCIMAFLYHLCGLSVRDQMHWHLHEIENPKKVGATIDARYVKPIVQGGFRDTISIYEAVYLYLREIQNLFRPDVLFPNLPDEKPLFLVPLAYNSEKAMADFAKDTYTLLQYNMKTLAKRILAPEVQEEISERIKKEQRRQLLKLYFTQNAILPAYFEEMLTALLEINELRKLSAHRLTQAKQDRNYFELQANLVDRLQSGLGSMMRAFAVTEKGTQYILSQAVLDYKVVVY